MQGEHRDRETVQKDTGRGEASRVLCLCLLPAVSCSGLVLTSAWRMQLTVGSRRTRGSIRAPRRPTVLCVALRSRNKHCEPKAPVKVFSLQASFPA